MTSVDQAADNAALPPAAEPGLLVNPAKLRLLAWFWIGVSAITYLVDLFQQTRDGLSNGLGRPFGDDFINYWSAPFLALHGRVAEVYDFDAFHAFEQSVVHATLQNYAYSYPPVMLLLTLPLATVPYVPALFVWLGATWYAFYRALRLTGHGAALLLSLATPALFISLVGGQNGAMTAALLGGGLVLVDRRPVLAGILFGLMVHKPHLALMLPFALLAGRRWLVVFVTGATATTLVAASVAIYGIDVWQHYQHDVAILRMVILDDGSISWHRMASIFMFVRHLGVSVGTCYALQAVGALFAVIFVVRAWWRDQPADIRNAVVVIGTCLATPYLQDYDLVIGAFVVAWLLAAEKHSNLPVKWIRGAMAVVLLLPIVNVMFAKAIGTAVGPLLLLPVFALLIHLGTEHARNQVSDLPQEA